ncbi:MAG: ABC transporter ATP-binding protein [Pseudooceanicola sp.]|nr:ABC transporter ATP-binding protein [Pseudooceanicola sp.]
MSLSVKGVTKRFGTVTAVEGVTLDVRDNEFFALLGPSGCGKTTLLRLMAGFEAPDEGSVWVSGQDVTRVPPRHRPLNLMFQSYALFPHMSVEKNIAYGLEMERLPSSEIRARVGAAMESAQLSALAGRRPDQLSGGQRQRVALARALVKRPKVLLLDEPLSALDRKLREEMQLELKRLQHEVGITFLIVTHDQEEALVMADRVAVLNAGRLAQMGTPQALYEHPESRFVAQFIGVMNMLEGQAVAGGVEVPGIGLLRGEGARRGEAVIAVRPERVVLAAAPPDGMNAVPVTVADIAYHGADLTVFARTASGARMGCRVAAGQDELPDISPGARVFCAWEPRHSRILDRET